MLLRATCSIAVLASCGTASRPPAAARTEPVIATPTSSESAAVEVAAPADTERSDEVDPESFEGLVAQLAEPPRTDHPVAALRPLHASIVPCDVEEEDCDLRSSAAFDTARREWVVFSVDFGEGGPEGFVISALDGSGAGRELLEGRIEREPLRRAAQLLRRYRALPAPTSLIERSAYATFSLNEYAKLVSLGGPLAGWLLTTESTEAPPEEEILILVRPDGSERHELARRAAAVDSCDGDGMWCESLQRECTLEELRAEGRACVEPMSIEYVALADNVLLLVQGVRQVAGHGGYPPTTWVVSLPTEVVRPRAD